MTDTRCEYCAVTMHLVFAMGRRVQELESDLYRLVEHEPAPEPDYEALGYPETAFGVDLPYAAVGTMAMVNALHECIEEATRLRIKNNDDDTDNG